MHPAAADSDESDADGWRRTTSILSVGQLITWGILYYSFAVYMPQMRDDLGWSLASLTGGFAVAVLVSGMASPLVGRRIDRVGSRTLMSLGAVTGTVGLVLWAIAQTLTVYYIAFTIIGLAMSATLYPPAFATVVRHYPGKSRSAIVAITLVAGLASTIFSPLAQVLAHQWDWRTGLLILAAGFAVTIIPLNLALPQDESSSAPTQHAQRSEPNRAGDAQPANFWLLAVVFTLAAGTAVAFNVHIIAFLLDKGLDATLAASIAGAAGISKVGGRVIIAAGTRYSATALLRTSLMIQAAFFAMPVVWDHTASSVIMVLMFGATSGALTVLRPVLIAELFGSEVFGSKNGQVQLITTLAQAAAPVAAGLLVTASTYKTTWLCLAVIVAAASLLTVRLANEPRHQGTAAAD